MNSDIIFEKLHDVNVREFIRPYPQPVVRSKSKVVNTDCVIGLELELEGVQDFEDAVHPIFSHYWRIEEDGSLRNSGVELILRRPLPPTKLHIALTAMDKFIRSLPEPPTVGQCTSTHVHMDVSNLTVRELMMFLFTYMIFEQPLIRSCGEFREHNLYCLTFKEASGSLPHLREVIKNPSYLREFSMDYYKYGACNLASIRHYGSLEFRMKGGERTKQDVLDWVNTLGSIKNYSKNFTTVQELVQAVQSPEFNLEQVFTEQTAQVVRDNTEPTDTIEACADIMYIVSDLE